MIAALREAGWPVDERWEASVQAVGEVVAAVVVVAEGVACHTDEVRGLDDVACEVGGVGDVA